MNREITNLKLYSMEYIWIILGGIMLYAVITALVKAPGNALNKKFVDLGTLTGKTYDEIVEVAGFPNSKNSMAKNQTLCQWIEANYHIVLLFDENMICLGISSETKV
jgi:hypothetical protein